MEYQNSIKVRVNIFTRILFSTGFVATGIAFLGLIRKPSLESAITTVIFGLIGWGLWSLASSYIEANPEFIAVKVPYGLFKIYWAEVTKILTNGMLIAFIGNDKHVVISLAFAGARTGELIETIDHQAQKRKLEVKKIMPGETMPVTHHNSREIFWR
jgi:hypothetical protein